MDAADSLIAITGPTGVGKSRFAIELAIRIGGEIVNFDSVQLVRGFDIGSAKLPVVERGDIPHHLIDVIEPGDTLNAAEFTRLAERAIRETLARGRRPILVGGTGFYLRALLTGLPEMPEGDERFRRRFRAIWGRTNGPRHCRAWLERADPAAADRIAAADRNRTERALEVWYLTGSPISTRDAPTATSAERWPNVKFALCASREVLNRWIDRRVEEMYERGLVDETRSLLARVSPHAQPFEAIGYREAVRVVQGEIRVDEAIVETRRRTRAYAKRQITWLRSQPGLVWLDVRDGIEASLSTVVERVEKSTLC